MTSELEREQQEDCPLGEYHHGTGFQALRHDRRIRALEAELAALRADEIRSQKEATQYYCDAVSRAEKAEARVRELERDCSVHRNFEAGFISRESLDRYFIEIAKLREARPDVEPPPGRDGEEC